jgi:two-component system, NtrC family, response regulator AtoC
MVAEGTFREDLYYRLSVLHVHLPPLRERRGDVPVLARYFMAQFNTELRRAIRGITPAAMAVLEAYPWPGNIRELRNLIERAVLLAESEELDVADFPKLEAPVEGAARGAGFELPPGGVDFEALERDLVLQALRRVRGNRTRAARLLGMNRDQIRYRIQKFGLQELL